MTENKHPTLDSVLEMDNIDSKLINAFIGKKNWKISAK